MKTTLNVAYQPYHRQQIDVALMGQHHSAAPAGFRSMYVQDILIPP